jgi:hypothetical protein
VIFPGCTSTTDCYSALPAAPSAVLFPVLFGYVACDWPSYHHSLYVLSSMYTSTPPVWHPPVHPPLISKLTFSALLPTPLSLVLRALLRGSQLPHGTTAGWTLQPRTIFIVVCVLLLSPCHLPYALRTPVPPLLLLTPLFPWTVWLLTSLCHFGSPYATPPAAVPSRPFDRSPHVCVWCFRPGQ